MSKIKALINPVTPFAQNAPIIYCENTKQCAFVDPGGDIETLIQIAHKNELIPAKILLTHGHADHAGGATELSNTLDIAIIWSSRRRFISTSKLGRARKNVWYGGKRLYASTVA